ncbi:arginine biosynthesis bifunctional protein ArgJ 1 [Propionigenium maris DSM 9537]|uniref:Arginine biosynthesis bifunctional protein ArgJ n=1 Tax=Propionigenium maris DSM 9537 TaxID=1123000 RepID=A0A9W6GLZ8_9FUSO|nr:bifunctional glutamate N-acetyltransferase/amino-acid acetyltransferase ArgJ [Propionigenium maris]GLI56261.1 arginine biosynthesis bifunctional protein ArgJ 1 [Propionigenium maris DSM 9537]
MKILKEKTITDVKGIKASGISGGLKKSGKKDLCVISSEGNPVASAVFTRNKVKAAPILMNMEHIKYPTTKAIVVNSGNANSCTGKEGLKNVNIMAQTVADALEVKREEVIVQSTGIIGVQLDMEKVIPAIKKGCSKLSDEGGTDAAIAIKTTDTFEKKLTVSFEAGGKEITLAGIAKGSGMVHPDMATMLSFLVTDLNISKRMLDAAFKESVGASYNMISVDGDTSTNDMAMILANGLAENIKIESPGEDYEKFKEALAYMNTELAKLIAKDGEGATKLIEVEVKNAKDLEGARMCAKAVIRSNLTKCAFFGADANWGRILCALGYSEAELDPDKVDISFYGEGDKIQIAKDGMGVDFDEKKAKEILLKEEVKVDIDLKEGQYSATAWGCDLSYDYVKINGAYRT